MNQGTGTDEMTEDAIRKTKHGNRVVKFKKPENTPVFLFCESYVYTSFYLNLIF